MGAIDLPQTHEQLGLLSSYVDGMFVAGSGGLEVENPATGEQVAEADSADLATFEQAIGAARRSFDGAEWADETMDGRAAVLRSMLDHIAGRRDELVASMVAQTGCPISLTQAGQVDAALQLGRDLIDQIAAIPEVEYPSMGVEELGRGPTVRVNPVRFEPVGVVSLITPYNFPLFVDIAKVIPALMTGCSAILRPSPLTPLTAPVFGEAASRAGLPPGVLNVLLEAGSAGAELMTTHPSVDAVSFTGSTAVGRAVARQAAETLKVVHLELGGKSAQIHLPGAAAGAAASGAAIYLNHAGQYCGAMTRVLVPEADKADVLDDLVDRVRQIRVGDPLDPDVQMGPVISRAQLEKCEAYAGKAVAAGASVALGGERLQEFPRGHYMAPTVIDSPDQENPAVREEIFGPVICVIGYRDVAHAIEMANDSDYGLSGAVFGPVDQAIEVAKRVRSGTVGVNGSAYTAWTPHAGWKQSGIGAEGGIYGARQFQLLKYMPIAAG
jgi:aldehyde dehydrogenase (NAD+)